jgi:hypothetical protein
MARERVGDSKYRFFRREVNLSEVSGNVYISNYGTIVSVKRGELPDIRIRTGRSVFRRKPVADIEAELNQQIDEHGLTGEQKAKAQLAAARTLDRWARARVVVTHSWSLPVGGAAAVGGALINIALGAVIALGAAEPGTAAIVRARQFQNAADRLRTAGRETHRRQRYA